MLKRILIVISCIIMVACVIGCESNNQSESNADEETEISYDITKPLVLEEDYYSIGPVGKGARVSFECEYVKSSDENIMVESVHWLDNLSVKFGKTDMGEVCIVVSDETKTVKLPCAKIRESSRIAYVHYVDFNRDGKQEIYISYWYDGNKYGMYLLDSTTFEKIDVVAPSGTMFTKKQADAINRAMAKFKLEYPEYIYLWKDIQGATGDEKELDNNTTENFSYRMTEDGILEIDVARQGYPSGGLVYIVTVQIAYKDGEFVVDKVIFDARDRG